MYSVEIQIGHDIFHRKFENLKIATNCFNRVAKQLNIASIVSEVQLWKMGEFGISPELLKYIKRKRK